MPALVEAALAARVNDVLLVIDKTVPITTLPVVLIIFPTLISVRKAVPVPVMVAEAVEVVIVPVRVVLGQAVALQLPEAVEITVAAITPVTVTKDKDMTTIKHLQDCKKSFIGTSLGSFIIQCKPLNNETKIGNIQSCFFK